MVLDISFFILAFVLSFLPLILEFKTRASQKVSNKPKWYKPTVIAVGLLVLGLGICKIGSDDRDKHDSDSKLLSCKTNGDTLKKKVDVLNNNIADMKQRDSFFQKELLSKFEIKLDSLTNKPIYVGTVDNRHTNNTHIDHAGTVDIH